MASDSALRITVTGIGSERRHVFARRDVQHSLDLVPSGLKTVVVVLTLTLLVMPVLVPFRVGALAAGLACDFNADGYSDLAAGVPSESVGGDLQAGAVNVIYGSASGLTAMGDQIWHQGSPGVPGASEEADLFGGSLACGDFDGDGFSDLAVGVPGEDLGGAVVVLYGSVDGLSASEAVKFDQDSPGVKGTDEPNDFFGHGLVSGDFDGDSFDDLAISVPREDSEDLTDRGAVHVLYGSGDGLSGAGDQRWHLDTPGVPGTASNRDFFAAASSGDFNGDGYDDLVATSRVASKDGKVHVIYGTGGGLDAAGSQVWERTSDGLPDSPIGAHAFGIAASAGDYDGDLLDDLAIGVLGRDDDEGGAQGKGAVFVIYGTESGLSADGSQAWRQSTPGIAGKSEHGDNFGYALASADFNGDGHSDLAVGVPAEDMGDAYDAGMVNIIYGSLAGLTTAGNHVLHQDSAGMNGTAEPGDEFGWGLAAADYDGDGNADLTIEVYGEDIVADTILNAGIVQVVYGDGGGLKPVHDEIWHQDTAGIKGVAEEHDRLGSALSGQGTRR